MNLTTDFLKKETKFIHYFGLGFIQLKLNDKERVHFYNKVLPAIIDLEDVHNHRYNFESKIISGSLKQNIYRTLPGTTHFLKQESCNPNNKVNISGYLLSIDLLYSHELTKNSHYFIDHNTFHNVQSDNCITYIKRSDYKKELADVITKVNQPLICPFSQKIEENYLWEIVDQMLKNKDNLSHEEIKTEA